VRPSILVAVVALAAALGASACAVSCTPVSIASVVVTVQDSTGALVTDATVTYQVDGGSEKAARCLDVEDAGCSKWVAGWEESGAFVVVATSGDGSKRAEETLTVSKDECHVQTEQVTLTLQ